jgi:tyrosyl-tRNA synthetase
LQLGGSDQWGNIVAGVDLVRREEAGKAFAMVCPLVTTASGEKMGKTGAGVRVWIDPEMFSPYDYFQYWVNTDDRMVEPYLKMLTFLPNEVIEELTSVRGEALREAKTMLAIEATALAHGLDAAQEAEATSKALFSSMNVTDTAKISVHEEASIVTISMPTTDIASSDVTNDFIIADAFVAAGLARGRGEARRLAQQGGLRIGDDRVEDVDQPFASVLGDDNAVVLRAGKKRFQRVVVA